MRKRETLFGATFSRFGAREQPKDGGKEKKRGRQRPCEEREGKEEKEESDKTQQTDGRRDRNKRAQMWDKMRAELASL